jgi:hypothetical protein
LSLEKFVNATYPSIPCKKITLSSTDNNIYLFGILFYDNTGQLINPTGHTFLSSSVHNVYKPNIAASGLYNYITKNNISRNLLSLQTTLINYSTSDNSLNINFKNINGQNIDLPAGFGTWNFNSKSNWVSATADSYSNTNRISESFWSITFPAQINLSAIELIGITSVNTTIKVDITDNSNNITFTQILPRTAPRDYYRQIVMPCQFYINIPDSKGNITNNYVDYSASGSNGYLIPRSISSNSKPDSFFLMQDTGKRLPFSPNRQIIYSSDGQNKFIYATNDYIKAKKQSDTSSFDEDHIQIRLGDFTNTPIDTSKPYVFGDYANYGFLTLYYHLFNGGSKGIYIFIGGSKGIPIKLIPAKTNLTIIPTAASTTIQQTQPAAIQQAPLSAIQQAPPAAIQQTQPAAIQQTPLSAIQQTPLSALQQAQPTAIQQAPLAALQQAPLSAIQQAPPAALQQAPLSAIQQAPLAALQQAPPAAIQQAPLSAIQQAPLAALQQAPPAALQQAPLSAIQQAQPTATLFATTPNNTQYLNNIQNQLDNGYTMLNNNRFTIIDNQLRLDNLNARINKLLDNINNLNNESDYKNLKKDDITFY